MYMYVYVGAGEACGASLLSPAMVTGRVHKKRVRAHVRLVLPLGREEPRCGAEDGRDHEADERCPAVFVSSVSLGVLGARAPVCHCAGVVCVDRGGGVWRWC